jgi:acetyl-CoA carboxylase biotin carboxyl carrier protein
MMLDALWGRFLTLARVEDRGDPLPLPNTLKPTRVELNEIRKIVELMNEHGLTHFDLSKKDFHLKLKKGPDMEELGALFSSMPSAPHHAAPAAQLSAAAPSAALAPAAEGSEITSPMVGTFYRKPAPDAPNFVEVGTAVSEGQTLCIIEAMKVMNEIKAEKSGTICALVATDGNPVQYGDILFRIK